MVNGSWLPVWDGVVAQDRVLGPSENFGCMDGEMSQ